MLERYDESEVLDLIEGSLDERSVAALQKRLAADAPARARVEAMVRDRASLRAVGEPALPQDFIAQIEPMLARPMLMEPVTAANRIKPGEFRRMHRRQTRRTPWTRIALAAALLLPVFVGAWGLVNGLADRSSGDATLALNDTPGDVAPRGSITDAMDRGFAQGTLHHDRPTRLAAVPSLTETTLLPPATLAPVGDAQPSEIVPAEFALVVHAKEPVAVEAMMSQAVGTLGDRSALVRNFSFAEAQRLAEEYRLANGGSDRQVTHFADGSAPPVAATSATEVFELAHSVRERWRMRAAAEGQPPNPTLEGDALLAGTGKLAPTLEQQLDFSSRGATYTIAVPASDLASLIERLALKDGQSMVLRLLPEYVGPGTSAASTSRPREPEGRATSQPTLAWFAEAPVLRQAMARVSQARGDTLVLVPVIVK